MKLLIKIIIVLIVGVVVGVLINVFVLSVFVLLDKYLFILFG